MSSKLLSLFLVILFINASFGQMKNKYNKNKQPKKWQKEEQRIQKAKEAATAHLKVWELEERGSKTYEADGFTAWFTPLATQRKPNDFRAVVSNRAAGAKYSFEDIIIEYRGACAKQIVVNTLQLGYKNELLEKFKKTRNIDDLPIENMLKSLVKGLKDQCDSLESVRFIMGPVALDTKKEGELTYEQLTYKGNLNKTNNWKLVEGFGPAVDGYIVILNTGTTLYQKLAVNYKGPCNTTQELKIAPVFTNATERYAYKEVNSLVYFEEVAKKAVEQFIAECPDVEEFEFSLAYIPDNLFIREGKKGLIRASKKDNWTIDTSEFGNFNREGPKIHDYEDILTQLEKKEFPFIERYTDFFKLFYEDFMDVYGSVCKSNLKNPTTIKIHAFENRYTSDGFKISENALGPPQVLHVESAYLARYKSYMNYNKQTVLYNVFRAYVNGKGNPTDAILSRLRGSQMIRKYINNNCSGEELKAVYNYMQELAATIK